MMKSDGGARLCRLCAVIGPGREVGELMSSLGARQYRLRFPPDVDLLLLGCCLGRSQVSQMTLQYDSRL